MTSEAADQTGIAGGQCVQHVADVQPGDGTSGALELRLAVLFGARPGEGDDRPVQALLDARF